MATPNYPSRKNAKLRRMTLIDLAATIDIGQAVKDAGFRPWSPVDQEHLDYARELLNVRLASYNAHAATGARLAQKAGGCAL